jgi:signal transduction histidine kinase
MASLADFLLRERDALASEWAARALTLAVPAAPLTREELESGARETMNTLVLALDPVVPREALAPQMDAIAREHALSRFSRGFALPAVVGEYRVMRAEVLRRWLATGVPLGDAERADLVRFNAAVDRLIMEMSGHYAADQQRARDLLLGTLGHDLRNPLSALTAGSQYLRRRLPAGSAESQVAERLLRATRRMGRLIGDLLDATRTKLGTALPVQPRGMDLEAGCHQVLDELREVHPDRRLWCVVSGDVRGQWDPDRVQQLLSNLIGNALVHGAADEPVTVLLRGGEDAVQIQVRNSGTPIPAEQLRNLFEPMVQGTLADAAASGRFHGLGLGLYIVREIARAHGGDVSVQSDDAGTVFAVRLPRGVDTRPPALGHREPGTG